MQNPRTPHALDAVLARASTDRAFRYALLTDPRWAILDVFGIEIPDGFRIRFIERDADTDALVVLPDLRENNDVEDALREVSGGLTAGAHDTWSGGWRRTDRTTADD